MKKRDKKTLDELVEEMKKLNVTGDTICILIFEANVAAPMTVTQFVREYYLSERGNEELKAIRSAVL